MSVSVICEKLGDLWSRGVRTVNSKTLTCSARQATALPVLILSNPSPYPKQHCIKQARLMRDKLNHLDL